MVIQTRPFRRGITPLPTATRMEFRAPSNYWRFHYIIECLKRNAKHLKDIRKDIRHSTTKEREAWMSERKERFQKLKRGIHTLRRFLVLHGIVPPTEKNPNLSKEQLLAFMGKTHSSGCDLVIDYLTNKWDMGGHDRLNNLEKAIPGLAQDCYELHICLRPYKGDKHPEIAALRRDYTIMRKVLAQADHLIYARNKKQLDDNADYVHTGKHMFS